MELTKDQKEEFFGLVQKVIEHSAMTESTILWIEMRKSKISGVKCGKARAEMSKRLEGMTMNEITELLSSYYKEFGLDEVDHLEMPNIDSLN